jgi:hypothetical protein
MTEFVPYKPKPGEVIAYVVGTNGDQLVYTKTDEEGMHWGYIYSPEHDKANQEMYIEALAKYLAFEVIPGKELFPPWDEDDDEEDELN